MTLSGKAYLFAESCGFRRVCTYIERFPLDTICIIFGDTNRINRSMAGFEQIKAARALLGWSQEDLAANSGVSVPTIKRLEAPGKFRVSDEARLKMEAALESAGIVFTNGDEPGVRLRKGRKSAD
jgi:DNA-binding XRE family transcriptional regulator